MVTFNPFRPCGRDDCELDAGAIGSTPAALPTPACEVESYARRALLTWARQWVERAPALVAQVCQVAGIEAPG